VKGLETIRLIRDHVKEITPVRPDIKVMFDWVLRIIYQATFCINTEMFQHFLGCHGQLVLLVRPPLLER